MRFQDVLGRTDQLKNNRFKPFLRVGGLVILKKDDGKLTWDDDEVLEEMGNTVNLTSRKKG